MDSICNDNKVGMANEDSSVGGRICENAVINDETNSVCIDNQYNEGKNEKICEMNLKFLEYHGNQTKATKESGVDVTSHQSASTCKPNKNIILASEKNVPYGAVDQKAALSNVSKKHPEARNSHSGETHVINPKTSAIRTHTEKHVGDISETGKEAQQKQEQEKEKDLNVSENKSIKQLIFGSYKMETLYASRFSSDYVDENTVVICVCKFCLKYMKDFDTYRYHVGVCDKTHPPGTKVYEKDSLVIYEIDGAKNFLYCQFACLIAKLYLKEKEFCYKLDDYKFFVLCELDAKGAFFVGFFSKEKQHKTANLACLFVLPPYQRKGYGTLLIEFSYELSRQEGIIAGPEHPLTAPGRCTYIKFWGYTLLKLIKDSRLSNQNIRTLSLQSGFTQSDIRSTLQSMKFLKFWDGTHSIVVPSSYITNYKKCYKAIRPKIVLDRSCLKCPRNKSQN